ncbi:chondroitin sulfate synthase [Mytilus galloprovincialis]|uniref:Hexosyltransferase n=1 Tax=Mytilus galloprovincialis TaxID=29158 RepID=A0A8B6FTA5_MYTGA|nr:chondroitin sulfate synthase [Mytilus galloprovincialis]
MARKIRLKRKPFAKIVSGLCIGILLSSLYRHKILSCVLLGEKCCRTVHINYKVNIGIDHLKFNDNHTVPKVVKTSNEGLDLNSYIHKNDKRFLLIGVMTTKNYLDTRAVAAFYTWTNSCSGSCKVIFFSSEGSTTEKQIPLVSLDGTDDSYPPQRKSLLMLKYMHDNYINNFEWFMRVDDDIFLRGDKIEKFLRSVNSSVPLFIGQAGFGKKEEKGKLFLNRNENYCMGGPGFLFSYKTLRHVGPHVHSCIDNLLTTHEDVEVGRCVHRYTGLSCTWAVEVITTRSVIEHYNLFQFLVERSKILDHSILLAEFKTLTNISEYSSSKIDKFKRFRLKSIPNDCFGCDLRKAALQTLIQRNETTRATQSRVDNIYSDLCTLIVDEMNCKIPVYDASRKTRKRHKSSNPFWNEELGQLYNAMRLKENSFSVLKEDQLPEGNFGRNFNMRKIINNCFIKVYYTYLICRVCFTIIIKKRKDINKTLTDKIVRKALTLHPIKDQRHLYRIQSYLLSSHIQNLHQKKRNLQREITQIEHNLGILKQADSITRQIIIPSWTKFKPRVRDEVLAWNFLSKSFISDYDLYSKSNINTPLKHALADSINHVLQIMNKNARQKGKRIDFKDLSYGYRRQTFGEVEFFEDPSTASANIEYKESNVLTFSSLGQGRQSLEIIHFIVPLAGKVPVFKRFMQNYEEVCLKDKEMTQLHIVVFNNDSTHHQSNPNRYCSSIPKTVRWCRH